MHGKRGGYNTGEKRGTILKSCLVIFSWHAALFALLRFASDRFLVGVCFGFATYVLYFGMVPASYPVGCGFAFALISLVSVRLLLDVCLCPALFWCICWVAARFPFPCMCCFYVAFSSSQHRSPCPLSPVASIRVRSIFTHMYIYIYIYIHRYIHTL